jgi:hypothetical protein
VISPEGLEATLTDIAFLDALMYTDSMASNMER